MPRAPDAPTGDGQGLAAPGLLLGVGLGGFVDGIVLHQILRWHHMISSTSKGATDTVAGLDNNTLADGVFHAATWLVTVAGLWLLWHRISRRRVTLDRQFLGWVLGGWGLFNVADEVVFHAMLDLHHIREGANELAYDVAFLLFGIVLVAAGSRLVRAPVTRDRPRPR